MHVILSCDTETNLRRLHARGGGDEARLMELRMEEEVYHLLNPSMRGGLAGLAGECEIETSALEAGGSAARVEGYIRGVLRGQGWAI